MRGSNVHHFRSLPSAGSGPLLVAGAPGSRTSTAGAMLGGSGDYGPRLGTLDTARLKRVGIRRPRVPGHGIVGPAVRPASGKIAVALCAARPSNKADSPVHSETSQRRPRVPGHRIGGPAARPLSLPVPVALFAARPSDEGNPPVLSSKGQVSSAFQEGTFEAPQNNEVPPVQILGDSSALAGPDSAPDSLQPETNLKQDSASRAVSEAPQKISASQKQDSGPGPRIVSESEGESTRLGPGQPGGARGPPSAAQAAFARAKAYARRQGSFEEPQNSPSRQGSDSHSVSDLESSEDGLTAELRQTGKSAQVQSKSPALDHTGNSPELSQIGAVAQMELSQSGSPAQVGFSSQAGSPPTSGLRTETSGAPSIALMESSSMYQRQKQEMAQAILQQHRDTEAGSKGPKDLVEVEIVTKDGIVKKQLSRSEMAAWEERAQASNFLPAAKKNSSEGPKDPSKRPAPGLKLSASDFAGLSFSDESKRSSRYIPAGLQAPADAPRQLPHVEIITRDASAADAPEGEQGYKPKVATWGVFPRPRDISRTYGGGRTIQPGQALETEEQKKAREEKTRRLLEEYSRLVGLKLDPAVKADAEKALASGTALMDKGKLAEAVVEFEAVTSKVPFQNELHGKAAIQKATCLDSMARNDEAKELYERLAAHPSPSVKRKAQQMLFGFRAAENLKFSGSSWNVEWYRQYFDQMSSKAEYSNFIKEEKNDDTIMQDALTYGAVLLMPLVLFLGVVLTKRIQ